MIAYVVSKPPGPAVWVVAVYLVAALAAFGILFGAGVLLAEWLGKRHPALACALGVLLIGALVGAVIVGTFIAGHPPTCAATGTC